jgi:hypothetical protein
MNNTISLAIVFSIALTATGYSQDKQSSRPELAPGMSLASPRETGTPGMQPPTPGLPMDDPDFTISKQVDEVTLILSVTDSKGRFVDDLTADDLKLLDNHKSPAKWNYFQARTNLPLHVILAIDVSSSIRERCHSSRKRRAPFLRTSCAKTPMRRPSSLLGAPCRREHRE